MAQELVPLLQALDHSPFLDFVADWHFEQMRAMVAAEIKATPSAFSHVVLHSLSNHTIFDLTFV